MLGRIQDWKSAENYCAEAAQVNECEGTNMNNGDGIVCARCTRLPAGTAWLPSPPNEREGHADEKPINRRFRIDGSQADSHLRLMVPSLYPRQNTGPECSDINQRQSPQEKVD